MTKASFIDSLSKRLTKAEPAQLVPKESAGVAVILRDEEGDEKVLLIKRAVRQSDPWSGHVAVPGGMVRSGDGSFAETAMRETTEEVGVDLSNSAVFLGYMHELKARMREIVVVPAVFRLRGTVAVTLSEEVASYEWVSLRELSGKEARSKYLHRRGEEEVAFPSLIHKDLVVWGLTERILSAIVSTREEPGDGRVLGEVGRY